MAANGQSYQFHFHWQFRYGILNQKLHCFKLGWDLITGLKQGLEDVQGQVLNQADLKFLRFGDDLAKKFKFG